MIVQCEQCNKRFKLNPDLINRPVVRVRCSGCKHVFRVSRPEKIDVMEAALASQEVKSPPPSSRKPSSRRLILFLIPLLLIAGSIALWLYVPWPFKTKPVEKSTGIEQLHLVETRGYFVENQKAGQLFVIQGRVRNEFSKPRRWIHLRAKIYTSDGETARQLDFYAGNILSNQQLQSMTLDKLLAFVQSQPASKDQAQVIGSRQEVSFTVPFGELPELTQLSDYSVEILASQPA
jgi:predicted Zn finger-like uncharacterized protein